MKNNVKFFAVVLSLLSVSLLLLIGCMYVIAADNGEAKPYNMEIASEIVSNGSIHTEVEDVPVSQSELQERFSSMYEIDEDSNTITVISHDYLERFWQSNYEREVIHSLTTDEVLFIIQDSINIYYRYDKLILPEFQALSSAASISERFPNVNEQVICRNPQESQRDYEQDKKNIHTIILYRLTVLSSPKAFIPAYEAILFVGDNPEEYNGMYPASLFYIPGYSAETDRNSLLYLLGGETDFTDFENWIDFFDVSPWGTADILFKTKETSTQVFPTAEMEHAEKGVS